MTDDSDIRLSCADFNYDLTSLFIGTNEEIKVFGLENFATIYESKIKFAYLMVQLWGTDVLCVVTKPSPQRLLMMRMSEDKLLTPKNFPKDILDIKSNKFVMVVGCRDGFSLYDMVEFKAMCMISRPSGFVSPFALSQVPEDTSYIAIPVSESSGDIEIFDAHIKKRAVTIRAHSNPLAAMVFHPTEQVLATASKKGTIIRLISIPSGTKLFEFRRGIQRTADIYSLSFSRDSNFLVSSGSTGTVHVFKYDLPWHKTENQSWSKYIGGAIKSSANYLLAPSTDMSINPRQRQGWTSYVGSMISSSATFIPKHMYEVCTQERSFLKVRLHGKPLKNISTIAKIQDVLRVVVFSEDSFLSVFELKEGSSSSLISKYSPVTGKVPTEILNDWCSTGDISHESIGDHEEIMDHE